MVTDAIEFGRLGRLLALIAFVTALFVLTAAETLDGRILQIGVFAIGTISAITGLIGVLIAASVAYDHP
ncbi:hypothetical protein GRX03_12655 [Halovenus sp. WSH3]|uniref:Uncharacterized protein n=1 Tax=Halovenus carboxidivorans TaxID=2692199 RepID=A0A6B0TAN0_9EURY|nr:hypothetical protein [Halovenus carboxidivorans]